MTEYDYSNVNINLLRTLLGESKWNKLQDGAKSLQDKKISDKEYEKIREDVYEKLVWKDIQTIMNEGGTSSWKWRTNWTTVKVKLNGGKVKRKKTNKLTKEKETWTEEVTGMIHLGLASNDQNKYKIEKEGIKRLAAYAILVAYDQKT